MTDETKGDGMTLSDKDKATLRELSEMYKSEGWGSPDYQEWERLTHPYSVDLLLAEIDSLKAAQSAMRVDEAMVQDVARALYVNGWSSGGDYDEDFVPDVRAALQAAIGGKE